MTRCQPHPSTFGARPTGLVVWPGQTCRWELGSRAEGVGHWDRPQPKLNPVTRQRGCWDSSGTHRKTCPTQHICNLGPRRRDEVPAMGHALDKG